MKRHALQFGAASVACAIAAPLAASPQGFFFVENDLSGTPLHGAWRSFDLYVQLEMGDVINTASWDSNDGLMTDGTFYDEDAGFAESAVSDDATFSIQNGVGVSDTYTWDSGVTLGLVSGLQFASTSRITWDETGTSGTWFLTENAPVADASNSGQILLARVTVSSDATRLCGDIFVGGTNGAGGDFGQQDPASGEFSIWCVPTPGAVGVFAVAGVFGARRRRAEHST